METQNTKKSFFKSKLFIIPLVALMMLGFVAAAVYISTTQVDVTVNEALSQSSSDFTITAMPGETWGDTLSIDNAANVDLYVDLAWVETSNNDPTNSTDDVTYTNDVNQVITIPAGSTQNIPLSWTIEEDSQVGVFSGTVTVTRVAEPV